MALNRAHLLEGPSLSLLQGGRARKPDRRSAADELHIELMTFFKEVADSAVLISDAECGLPAPSLRVWNEASKLAYRSAEMKRQYLALRPDGDAA